MDDFDLSQWVDSIAKAVTTGATYSLAFPITNAGWCNEIGQVYHGPVMLITDALCYSATDIFAAGFQDHDIGPILGVDDSTGAGGANVWSHRMLRELLWEEGTYTPLPLGADFRIAVRRTVRVGANAGDIVEDLGVRPDHLHRMTRRDLLEDNVDLIEQAAQLLALRKAYAIEADFTAETQVDVTTRNLTRLDVFLNARPRQSLDVQDGVTTLDLAEMRGEGDLSQLTLELRGYDGQKLAVVYRRQLGS
jgi:hypothetical protein